MTSAAYVNVFTPEQLNVMATLSVRSPSAGFGVALIFFGVECAILGHLISRSGYMPRSIGVLMQMAGVCYVINSFALLLSPPLSSRLFPAILIRSLIAEPSLCVTSSGRRFARRATMPGGSGVR